MVRSKIHDFNSYVGPGDTKWIMDVNTEPEPYFDDIEILDFPQIEYYIPPYPSPSSNKNKKPKTIEVSTRQEIGKFYNLIINIFNFLQK